MNLLDALAQTLASRCPDLELREQEPMARHTSFRVGGPVKLMALPRTAVQAAEAVRTAAGLGVVPFYMGNGSNLLVSDAGYDGFIVKPAGELDLVREENGRLAAGSAVLLSRLANTALNRGLTGLEFAHGIPGSLGGGVTMNAGAYGGELCQVISSVTCLTLSGEVETIPAERCAFSYRHSAFSGGERLILGAEFLLQQGERNEIKARMDELARRRREKQPLEYPSAGSTFKRPTGYFAAALIEECGLKGHTIGGAQVSEKHAGFLINKDGATCDDLRKLIDYVRETVLRERGVLLELEVKTLGF